MVALLLWVVCYETANFARVNFYDSVVIGISSLKKSIVIEVITLIFLIFLIQENSSKC